MKFVLLFTLCILYKSNNLWAIKLPHKLTLEGTLHSRVKDFTTDNSTVIFSSNSKGRLNYNFIQNNCCGYELS